MSNIGGIAAVALVPEPALAADVTSSPCGAAGAERDGSATAVQPPVIDRVASRGLALADVVAPGETTIVPIHRSGVSSHASGDHATCVAKPIVRLDLETVVSTPSPSHPEPPTVGAAATGGGVPGPRRFPSHLP